jgi:hypothetical protein
MVSWFLFYQFVFDILSLWAATLLGILYCDLFIPSGSLVEGGVTFLNVSIAAFCMIIGNESPEGLLGMGDSILDAQIDIGIQSWSI